MDKRFWSGRVRKRKERKLSLKGLTKVLFDAKVLYMNADEVLSGFPFGDKVTDRQDGWTGVVCLVGVYKAEEHSDQVVVLDVQGPDEVRRYMGADVQRLT